MSPLLLAICLYLRYVLTSGDAAGGSKQFEGHESFVVTSGINIAVLIHCVSHNRPVHFKLNILAALVEGSVVVTSAHITWFFCYDSETARPDYGVLGRVNIRGHWRG